MQSSESLSYRLSQNCSIFKGVLGREHDLARGIELDLVREIDRARRGLGILPSSLARAVSDERRAASVEKDF